MAENKSPLTGLTEAEAKEFHSFFMMGFIVYTIIAIIAHILVWSWRPWIPGPEGYTSMIDSINGIVSGIAPYIA